MKNNKFSLGILGLGSRTTAFYLEQINHDYQVIYGGYSTCPLVLLNANFNEINPYLPNNFNVLKEHLMPYCLGLKKLGVKSLLLPNITLHETIDQMEMETNFQLSILHPLKSTLNVLLKENTSQIVLFGSLYSMQSTYISKYFEKHGIAVSLPTKKDMVFLDAFRKDIYYHHKIPNKLVEYQQLLEDYSKDKKVVIACTELSLAVDKISKNVHDMARIQIAEAISLLK